MTKRNETPIDGEFMTVVDYDHERKREIHWLMFRPGKSLLKMKSKARSKVAVKAAIDEYVRIYGDLYGRPIACMSAGSAVMVGPIPNTRTTGEQKGNENAKVQ